MNIIVLNLPRETTQEELAALFAPHGAVTACNLVMDKETRVSKGFGFVEMANHTEAITAIGALHGSKVGKRKIRVKVSEPKQ